MTFPLKTKTWLLALTIAQCNGCKPPFYIFGAAQNHVDRDGVRIAPNEVIGHVWPQINDVREEFLDCLLSSLILACDQLQDESLDISFYILGVENAVLRKSAISPEEIGELVSLRDWCRLGAFKVQWSPNIQLLSR